MKKTPLSYLFLVIIMVTSFVALCDDVTVPSVGKGQETLGAPVGQFTSTNYVVSFWWGRVDHALPYHLPLAPNFAAAGSLVFDALVKINKFPYTSKFPQLSVARIGSKGGSQTVYKL